MPSKLLLASFLYSFLFSSMAIATPVPGQNVQITDAEWSALKETGLRTRSKNVPITDAEWKALEASGLNQRDGALQSRDSVLNCGTDVTGSRNIGGNHIGWVPWTGFNTTMEKFCRSYTGTSISKNHETSETYPVTLTNQDDPSLPGAAGNIVFAIYNTKKDAGYTIDKATCMNAMQAPILTNYKKSHNKNGHGDLCYGSLHSDVEGGYYSVEGIGAFGSEVSKA